MTKINQGRLIMKDNTNKNFVSYDARLTRAELCIVSIQDDLKELKRNSRYIMGLVFTLNVSLLGLLIKGIY